MKTPFDFSQGAERQGSDSLKWARYAGRDILPMWVADMDFAAPPAVLDALKKRIEHGVFGYSLPLPSVQEAVCEHLLTRYDWQIEEEWIVWLPGLVTGLNVACRAIDGAVLTATPVYPPFLSAPLNAGRTLHRSELRLNRSAKNVLHWEWDWPALNAAPSDSRLFLLCHPHNPVGRAWNEDELQQLAAIAKARDWIVCSDEIHCDLLLDPQLRHRPFASLSPDAAARTITLMAPSKTFNIPGLGCAFAVIANPALRQRFEAATRGIVPHVNSLGYVACEAAFRHGEPWRQGLIAQLAANRDRLAATIATLPDLAMAPIEATYLAWIDARALAERLGVNPAKHFEDYGLGLSDGAEFAAPGWVRLNFGCPPARLEEALVRLTRACHT